MPSYKVAHAVVTYLDPSGAWQTALRGQTITVHDDDLERISDGLEESDRRESDDGKPAGNASRDAWAEYALAHDMQLRDDMTRDEIRDLFK